MFDGANFAHPAQPDEPEPEAIPELSDAEIAARLRVEPEAPEAIEPELAEDGPSEAAADRIAEAEAAMTAQAIVQSVFGAPYRYVRGWLPKSAGADPVDKRYGITLYGHSGWDIAAPKGTPVYALSGGQVSFANSETADPKGARANAVNYGGKSVVVNLGNDTHFAYMHLSQIAVNPGQTVEPGELLGYVGSTGVSTGPHLLFAIRQGGKYVDPTPFLRGLANSGWQPPKAKGSGLPSLPAFPTLPPVGTAFSGSGQGTPSPATSNLSSSDLVMLGAFALLAVAVIIVATAGRTGGTAE